MLVEKQNLVHSAITAQVHIFGSYGKKQSIFIYCLERCKISSAEQNLVKIYK